ncbi:glycosyltransferase family 4 protein [Candidatus Kaiserbacteria bacterium]|nr:glycosyltransferase family 4 protein [Candidatus Kaiserbacteria bacterium]
MRLLIATGLYPPEIGGPATYAKLFEQELPRHGFEVHVLPFSLVRHMPPIIRHIAYAWLLSKRIGGADLVLVQDTVSTGLPVALMCMLAGKKFVVRVPGDYAWEQGVQRFGVKDSLEDFQKHSYGRFVGIFRAIQNYVVRRARCVIVPSSYLKHIVDSWGVTSTVIYNGIDTRRTDVAREENLIVSAGRLVPWKGFAELIEIVLKHPHWHLVIVGDGPEKERLEKLTNRSDRVTFAGKIPNAELRRYMARATVFVLNSSYEGLSHTLLEASAEGAPILATKVGGNPEIVSREALIEKGELEYKLVDLLSNPAKRAKCSTVAISLASAFSIDACVKRTAELLKSL